MQSFINGFFCRGCLWKGLTLRIASENRCISFHAGKCFGKLHLAMGTLSLNKYDLFTNDDSWHSSTDWGMTEYFISVSHLYPFLTNTEISFSLPSFQLRVNLSSPLYVAHTYTPFNVEILLWMLRKPGHTRPSQLFSQESILGTT